MPLLILTNADLAYGDLPLLDRASFALEERERIGLIGRNGTGKSSLLGILAGTIALDDGELRKKDGLRIVLVPQEPAFPISPPAAAQARRIFPSPRRWHRPRSRQGLGRREEARRARRRLRAGAR